MASFAGSADYTSGSATATFTINKAAPTLSVTDSGGTYSGAEFPATSASLEGVTPTLTYYAGTTATGTPLSGPPTAAGTYTVVASFAGSTDYTSGSATATFTINKAAPTLFGGQWWDVLMGEAGLNVAIGGSLPQLHDGRLMMSGTLGWSTILISSLTAYYDNDPALNYLLQEWDNHSIPIAVEVSNLRKRFGGTPTPKGPATVLKTPADLCYGSSTQDWFWCTLDPVVFQPPNETSRQSAREDTTSDAEDERVLPRVSRAPRRGP